MKYIRTDTNIWEVLGETRTIYSVRAKGNSYHIYNKSKRQTNVIKQADTIEELCDEFVALNYLTNYKPMVINYNTFGAVKTMAKTSKVMGAIWTDKGLIYVAKMNEKGELELL